MNFYHSSNYLFKQLANERIVQVSKGARSPNQSPKAAAKGIATV